MVVYSESIFTAGASVSFLLYVFTTRRPQEMGDSTASILWPTSGFTTQDIGIISLCDPFFSYWIHFMAKEWGMMAMNLKRFVYVCHWFLLLYFCMTEWLSDTGWGLAIAQRVSGPSLIVESWVWCKAILFHLCRGRRGTGVGFPPGTSILQQCHVEILLSPTLYKRNTCQCR